MGVALKNEFERAVEHGWAGFKWTKLFEKSGKYHQREFCHDNILITT